MLCTSRHMQTGGGCESPSDAREFRLKYCQRNTAHRLGVTYEKELDSMLDVQTGQCTTGMRREAL